jgi:cholecystokinin A receptor
VTALLILNLAFCDFVIVLMTPLRVADILMPRNPDSGDVYCKVGSFFSLFLACITFLSIVAISYERLLLICYPLKAKSLLTVSRTLKIILASWVMALVSALPLPILYTFIVTIPLSNKIFQFCLMNVFPQSCDNPGGTAYFLFLFLSYYLVPMITISVCSIFHTLYKGDAMLLKSSDPRQHRVIETRKSLAKMMLFIAVSFTLLHGPYFFTFLFLSIGFHINNHAVFLLTFIEFLPLVSAIINPFVYSVRTRTFKKSVDVDSQSGHRDSLLRRSMQRSSSREPERMHITSAPMEQTNTRRPETAEQTFVQLRGFSGDEMNGSDV